VALKYANLTAQVDGVTTTFTLPDIYLPGTVRLFLGGMSQLPNIAGGGFFDEVPPNQIVLEEAPELGDEDGNLIKEHIEVEYQVTDAFNLLQASGIDPLL
jgi:hypothetical protein